MGFFLNRHGLHHDRVLAFGLSFLLFALRDVQGATCDTMHNLVPLGGHEMLRQGISMHLRRPMGVPLVLNVAVVVRPLQLERADETVAILRLKTVALMV